MSSTRAATGTHGRRTRRGTVPTHWATHWRIDRPSGYPPMHRSLCGTLPIPHMMVVTTWGGLVGSHGIFFWLIASPFSNNLLLLFRARGTYISLLIWIYTVWEKCENSKYKGTRIDIRRIRQSLIPKQYKVKWAGLHTYIILYILIPRSPSTSVFLSKPSNREIRRCFSYVEQ